MFQSFRSFKPFKSLTDEESEPEVAGSHVLSLVEKMQRAQNKFYEHFRVGARRIDLSLIRQRPGERWDKSV